MILFFARGSVDSDKFAEYCYSQYRSLNGEKLPDKVRVVRNDGVKPRFDTDAAHFNLSHSFDAVMVGISNEEIGVDIEKLRPVDFKKFPFIKTETEEEFFTEWTARESYVKFTGVGIKGIRRADLSGAHFEHFYVFDNYVACVCSAHEQNITAYEIDLNAVI